MSKLREVLTFVNLPYPVFTLKEGCWSHQRCYKMPVGNMWIVSEGFGFMRFWAFLSRFREGLTFVNLFTLKKAPGAAKMLKDAA